ncbi:hypothetical protein EDB19DRAFT_1672793 [Suillus lakei]|nr:hypothetical protein EDB19DRAFT_1672793 [Suillus lakei]
MWISAPPSFECSQVREVLNLCPFLGSDTDKGCELMYGSYYPLHPQTHASIQSQSTAHPLGPSPSMSSVSSRSGKPCTASSVWVERIDDTSESELSSEEDRGRKFRGNGMGRLEAQVHKKSCVSRDNCVNFCEEHAAGLLDGLLFLSEEGEGIRWISTCQVWKLRRMMLGRGCIGCIGSMRPTRPRTAPKQPSITTSSPPSPWRGSSAP